VDEPSIHHHLFYQPLTSPAQKVWNLSNAFFFQREPWRIPTALSLSLLAHTLLLSITIAGQTFGLPGLNFPWKERRLGADDLRIMLAPARPVTPAPADGPAPAKMAQPAPGPVDEPALAPQATSMPMPSPSVGERQAASVSMPAPAPAAPAPLPVPVATARKQPDAQPPTAAETRPASATDTFAQRPTPDEQSDLLVPGISANQAQERTLEQARLEREKQSTERLRQAELTATAQREANRQEQLRQEQLRQEQLRQEAARAELARQEAMRREALQKERASQDEKARQEATRHELERADAARLEAARIEAARVEAARVEAARVEAARSEAARQEQSRQAQLDAARQAQLDLARQDAIRQETARREAARQEAARQEQARQEQLKQEQQKPDQAKQDQAQRERAEQEEKRMERLRAIGKQLDQEAAQRNAAADRPASTLPPTVSSLRRGWVFGRADLNPDLVLYAEAMSRKIEMNMTTMDMAREAVKQPHAQPIVTVAIRADGSVEKVTFVVSSGVPAIDAAIRKIVASQAPYAAFTPAMARQYDVIEIRRTWTFDIAIRLQ
jgi:hypothetical protein